MGKTIDPRRVKVVQLVAAPRDQETSPISRSGAYQPLGLLSIASHLLQTKACAKVEILDGEFLSVDEIESRLTADLVGISCTTPSYRSALRVARAAKNRGATVVLGGPHATAVSSQILENRPEVDFVVRGEGEIPLAQLVLADPPSQIPGLTYRHVNKMVKNPEQLQELSSLPLLDRTLLHLEPYIERYASQAAAIPGRRPAAIYSQKGCMWRHQSGGCVFCGRLDRGWRGRPTDQVWREVENLATCHNVNYVWDVSDSFTSSRDWVLRFAAARPSGLGVGFFVYARSSELDEDVVQALAVIGCQEVFIGIESGSNVLLQAANKGTTPSDNLRAANLLAENGIRMFPCFVLGLPGETEDSLERTIRHAEVLARTCEWSTASASVLVPLPGSRAFDQLKSRVSGGTELSRADTFDLETLGRLWVETSCAASWHSIHAAVRSILDLSPCKSSFFNFEPM